MIRDVHVRKLAVHNDDRGTLMEVLRAEAPLFESTTWAIPVDEEPIEA